MKTLSEKSLKLIGLIFIAGAFSVAYAAGTSSSNSGSSNASAGYGNQPANIDSRVPTEPDNTAVNKRDSRSTTLTPENQARGSDRDVQLTRLARQRIVSDDTLSTNAKNIKIITLNSVMTLRGPVESMAEKNRVGELARAAAPRVSVINELEITSTTK